MIRGHSHLQLDDNTNKQLDFLRKLIIICRDYDNYDEIKMHIVYQLMNKNEELINSLNITKEESVAFQSEHIFGLDYYD